MTRLRPNVPRLIAVTSLIPGRSKGQGARRRATERRDRRVRLGRRAHASPIPHSLRRWRGRDHNTARRPISVRLPLELRLLRLCATALEVDSDRALGLDDNVQYSRVVEIPDASPVDTGKLVADSHLAAHLGRTQLAIQLCE
eukprot:CAMPEP_0181191272 /NCGR_PEP_ID=MMETSP1096-20121128/12648_1 /TAXON_ID=156174 ORGANISM="Chrysochromulina ericina, Strain CCMP281" /NCGR_SAMPLE_ID=MMETSP1096 /ASSEMBLY_ACC=CAM_ASM_000453 /LENGTH=141 /DNA_ID=CAMNT_0023280563 /DNA_START=337 /DNA_END=762 /DNA_ORIENTATION=-